MKGKSEEGDVISPKPKRAAENQIKRKKIDDQKQIDCFVL